MNMLLAIIMGSTLGAMFLWAVHVERRRSRQHEREDEQGSAESREQWAVEDRSRSSEADSAAVHRPARR
jgi:hypothetical protein